VKSELHPALLQLRVPTLSESDLRSILRCGGLRDREAVANLWLSEGIPSAFSECPGLYEHVRLDLADRLGVTPASISMTGSRRMGYSMNPKQWGHPPRVDSDLDLFVADEGFFKELVGDFESWKADFLEERISAKTVNQQKWWPMNAEEGPHDVARGFLSPLRIPELPRYRARSRLGKGIRDTTRSTRVLAKTLRMEGAIGYAPFPFRVRVYKTWHYALAGLTRSLTVAAGALRRTEGKK